MKFIVTALAALLLSALPSLAEPGLTRVERPQATSGLFTAIPLLHLSGATLSYIRFINLNATATVFGVDIIGSPSGNFYGAVTVSVPGLASLQFAAKDILKGAGVSTAGSADASYSMYVQNSDQLTGFQHVFYNSVNGFFENASVCPYIDGYSYVIANEALVNVHTSVIQGYPSYIGIHNITAAPITYDVIPVDSRTGLEVGNAGGTTATVPAHASFVFTEASLEQAVNWQPTAAQNQINVLFAPKGGGTFGGFVEHAIINGVLAAEVNMTLWCPLNH